MDSEFGTLLPNDALATLVQLHGVWPGIWTPYGTVPYIDVIATVMTCCMCGLVIGHSQAGMYAGCLVATNWYAAVAVARLPVEKGHGGQQCQ